MAVNWVNLARGVQAVLSVVALGLMAYVANWWSSHWHQTAPAEVNFMVFAPVWTLLAITGLLVIPWKLPRVAEQTFPRIALLALEAFTALIWLGSFVSLGVFLTDRICFGAVCSVAKTGVAISAFEFAVWLVTLGINVWFAFRGSVKKSSGGEKEVEMHQGV